MQKVGQEPEVNAKYKKNILNFLDACVRSRFFGAMHYLQTTFSNNEKTVRLRGEVKLN